VTLDYILKMCDPGLYPENALLETNPEKVFLKTFFRSSGVT